MEQRQIELFDKQLEFLALEDNEALLDAGIGFGKTTVAALWLAQQAINHPGTQWIMAARDAKQLKNASDKEFQTVLQVWLGLQENVHYTRKESPRLTYRFINGSEIHGFGAHNYDSVFRGGNYSGGWADEVDYWKEDAYFAFKGRIRVYPELVRYTSSPKGFNHVWRDFYQNKIGPVVQATSYDNPTLSQRYFDSLKKTYSPKMFQQEVMAVRLNLKLGQVYDEFDRDRHVRPCKHLYDRNKHTLYFFTDYNISNYCGVYMFEDNGQAYAIGEEHLKFQGTEVMAQQIKHRYPEAIIIGDQAGNTQRGTAITQTNYQIFEKYGLRTQSFRNPPVEQRIINANSRFYHDKLILDPGCPNTVRDLELVSWKEDGSGIAKTDISLSHSSDAYTYGVWHLLNIYENIAPLEMIER